jgi:hypothetical protein
MWDLYCHLLGDLQAGIFLGFIAFAISNQWTEG